MDGCNVLTVEGIGSTYTTMRKPHDTILGVLTMYEFFCCAYAAREFPDTIFGAHTMYECPDSVFYVRMVHAQYGKSETHLL